MVLHRESCQEQLQAVGHINVFFIEDYVQSSSAYEVSSYQSAEQDPIAFWGKVCAYSWGSSVFGSCCSEAVPSSSAIWWLWGALVIWRSGWNSSTPCIWQPTAPPGERCNSLDSVISDGYELWCQRERAACFAEAEEEGDWALWSGPAQDPSSLWHCSSAPARWDSVSDCCQWMRADSSTSDIPAQVVLGEGLAQALQPPSSPVWFGLILSPFNHKPKKQLWLVPRAEGKPISETALLFFVVWRFLYSPARWKRLQVWKLISYNLFQPYQTPSISAIKSDPTPLHTAQDCIKAGSAALRPSPPACPEQLPQCCCWSFFFCWASLLRHFLVAQVTLALCAALLHNSCVNVRF